MRPDGPCLLSLRTQVSGMFLLPMWLLLALLVLLGFAGYEVPTQDGPELDLAVNLCPLP